LLGTQEPRLFSAADGSVVIEIDHQDFRTKALDAINQVTGCRNGQEPHRSRCEIEADWCISRQRTWGVPITAFYDAQGNPLLDARVVRQAAALFEKHGSNVWFEKSSAELWSWSNPLIGRGRTPWPSQTIPGRWIDSGSSSRTVLQRRKELQHKAKTGNWAGVCLAGGYVCRGQ